VQSFLIRIEDMTGGERLRPEFRSTARVQRKLPDIRLPPRARGDIFQPEVEDTDSQFRVLIGDFDRTVPDHWLALIDLLMSVHMIGDPGIVAKIYGLCQSALRHPDIPDGILASVLWILTNLLRQRSFCLPDGDDSTFFFILGCILVQRQYRPVLVRSLQLLEYFAIQNKLLALSNDSMIVLFGIIETRIDWAAEFSACILNLISKQISHHTHDTSFLQRLLAIAFSLLHEQNAVTAIQSLRSIRRLVKHHGPVVFSDDYHAELLGCIRVRNLNIFCELIRLFWVYHPPEFLRLNVIAALQDSPMIIYPDIQVAFLSFVMIVGESFSDAMEECLHILNFGLYSSGTLRVQRLLLGIFARASELGIVGKLNDVWENGLNFVSTFLETDIKECLLISLRLLSCEEHLEHQLRDQILELSVDSDHEIGELATALLSSCRE
jgi:hypothetical protein